jgi:transcriptional regulator with XRE-family HTH domain
MADLSQLLRQGMRRRHLNAQALAARTGIRAPRIRVFAQDGAHGPVHPTPAELAELANALDLPLPDVLEAARTPPAVPSVSPAPTR